MEQTLIGLLENNVKKHWDSDSLSDYQGETLKGKQIATQIAKLHILFEEMGIQRGDKIALCGRNTSNWCVCFLGIITYGAVAVPILHEFKPEQIHNIVNHSDARILFAGDIVWKVLDGEQMTQLEGVIQMNDYSIPFSRNEALIKFNSTLDDTFAKKYPKGMTTSDVDYTPEDDENKVALINYTSGTTSSSKGVLLPYRAIVSNIVFGFDNLTLYKSDNIVSMLPLAHMYGLLYEFLFEFCSGAHVWFLTRVPSPKIIFQAFAELKPRLIVAVPLIIEKVMKTKVMPQLQTPKMKILLHLPIINHFIKKKIRAKLVEAFGGKFFEIIVGGAGFNQDVEKVLRMIRFPYSVGYGMTECAPLVCYTVWDKFVAGSCGQPVDRMQVRILSRDPENVVGEIIVKGDNVMLGYYKNEEATRQALDEQGWLHTGDLGIIDSRGNLFIRGRSKNMILGPSGQNIYPEEIEEKLNMYPLVAESIISQGKDLKLKALVHPDTDAAKKQDLTDADVEKAIEEYRVNINQELPAYSQIASVTIHAEEFEKTPKRSIKRFLYQDSF